MKPVSAAASDADLDDGLSLRVRLYRYFFYGWLFRDAEAGSELERSAALRHNLVCAKWLPVYLRRWAVGGVVILSLESLAERLFGDSLLAAALAVMLIFVVMFELITAVCWAFLRAGRPSR